MRRLLGGLAALAGLAITAVLFDFAFDLRPAGIADVYRFELPELPYDQPRILRSGNLAVVVIRRSPRTIARLEREAAALADPGSRGSRQPEAARNPLRSLHAAYFVAYATGTDFGCELVVDGERLREVCGSASWDFAGRAPPDERGFHNLTIPDYHFSANFKRLVIRP